MQTSANYGIAMNNFYLLFCSLLGVMGNEHHHPKNEVNATFKVTFG